MKTIHRLLPLLTLLWLAIPAYAQDKVGEFVMVKSDGDIARRIFTTVGTIVGRLRAPNHPNGSVKTEAERRAGLVRSNFITQHYLLSSDRMDHWDTLAAKIGDALVTGHGFKANIDITIAEHVNAVFTASHKSTQFGASPSDEGGSTDLFQDVKLTEEFCAEIVNRLAENVRRQKARLAARVEQWRIDRGVSYVTAYLELKDTEAAAAALQRFKEQNGLK